jgi:acyl carrier protein
MTIHDSTVAGARQALIRMWSELLDLPADKIGIDDDFFLIGGDSFAAIVLCMYVAQELKMNLTPEQLTQHSTIARILSLLGETTGRNHPPSDSPENR